MPDVVTRPPQHPRINAYEAALAYANDVIAGKVVAGKLVILACKRFLRDLKTGHERGLWLDRAAAQHVVDFFGCLRHAEGEWGRGEGQVFVLSPWQTFILANLFGWKRADGTRRFREGHIEVARKNGKSTFAAGVGLYMMLADDEQGAQVYSAACDKDQAKIIFHTACKIRDKSPLIAKRVSASGAQMKWISLFVLSTYSKFEPLSREDGTQDGLNVHCGLVDELHQHKTRAMYELLNESVASRRQPLLLTVTTAGYNKLGVCFQQRTFGENILVGNVSAKDGDHFFAFIACLDEEDIAHWDDERNWAKANPNLGVSVKLDKLRADAVKAKEQPVALNSFLCKHLDIWTSQDVRWMPPDKWAACNSAGPTVDPRALRDAALSALAGRRCFGGLDVSEKIDLTAFVLVFPPCPRRLDRWYDENNKIRERVVREADPKWRVIPFFWLPEECVAARVKKDRVPYDVWVREGFIETTPGNVVDQLRMRTRINELRQRFQVEEIGFDPWNATELATRLQEEGAKPVQIFQVFKHLSEPMKALMGMVLDRNVEHYGNPVLTWCVGNVQAIQDPNGNIRPDKEKSKEKIDGLTATLDALNRALISPPEPGDSPYENRGIIFI